MKNRSYQTSALVRLETAVQLIKELKLSITMAKSCLLIKTGVKEKDPTFDEIEKYLDEHLEVGGDYKP